jgi:preprotein translocase subunit SecG
LVILSAILNTLMVLTCLFLICLILIQRGKGGGLAGAFGGVGGSSAFGTKSGDVFTKVTMVVASIWIVLSMVSVIVYNQAGQSAWGDEAPTTVSKEIAPKKSTRDKAAPGTTRPTVPPTSPSSPSSPSSSDTGTGPKSPVDAPAIPAPVDKKK